MENRKDDHKSLDFYTEALQAMDAPAPKHNKMKFGWLVSLCVAVAALLLWRPWSAQVDQPTTPTTYPTQPGLPFDNGIVFHHLQDVYVGAAAVKDQLELTGDEARDLSGLLSQEEWFDLAMLDTDIYPIGSIELIRDGQSIHYEFTANGLLVRDGEFANMRKSWQKIASYMAQANAYSCEGGYLRDPADHLSRRLLFHEDGNAVLAIGIRSLWQRPYIRVGDYLFLLHHSQPGMQAFRIEENAITVFEPFSDTLTDGFVHADPYSIVPGHLEQFYGSVTIWHYDQTTSSYVSTARLRDFSKNEYHHLRNLLNQLSWQEAGSKAHDMLFVLEINCMPAPDERMEIRILSDGLFQMIPASQGEILETRPTKEQRDQLFAYLSSFMEPIEHNRYQTRQDAVNQASVVLQADGNRFVYRELGNSDREGTCFRSSNGIYLFFDDGQTMSLKRKYYNVEVYIDSQGREYAPDGIFPQ